jgi:hypothetical protein
LGSYLRRKSHPIRASSEIVETPAGIWLDVNYGQPAPALFEQVYVQAGAFALIMLWVELADEEEDGDGDRTSKQRLQDRLAQWGS